MRICGKSPPTNTAETPLFCIGKVKKQLLFTENLRLWQGMGAFYLFPAVFCLFRLGIFWVILRSVARQVFWKTWLVRLAAGGGFCRCLRRGREKVCYHLRWGEIFRKLGLYACPAGAGFVDAFGGGVKKFAITSGGARFLENLVCTPARRGHPFVPTKGCKNGSGLRPKNPVALLRWIRI